MDIKQVEALAKVGQSPVALQRLASWGEVGRKEGRRVGGCGSGRCLALVSLGIAQNK